MPLCPFLRKAKQQHLQRDDHISGFATWYNQRLRSFKWSRECFQPLQSAADSSFCTSAFITLRCTTKSGWSCLCTKYWAVWLQWSECFMIPILHSGLAHHDLNVDTEILSCFAAVNQKSWADGPSLSFNPTVLEVLKPPTVFSLLPLPPQTYGDTLNKLASHTRQEVLMLVCEVSP